MTVIYGDQDDNVPPKEPRYMARMVDSTSQSANAVKVIELPGVGHWFPQNIPEMSQALHEHLPMKSGHHGLKQSNLPELPETFEFTVMNTASFGTKGNLKVLQQEDAARPSKLFVHRCVTGSQADGCIHAVQSCAKKFPNGQVLAANGRVFHSHNSTEQPWIIDTDNVRRFTLVNSSARYRELPRVLRVDGQVFNLASMNLTAGQHFCSTAPDGVDSPINWNVCTSREWEEAERGGPAAGSGPMQMVLRRAPVCIAHGSAEGHRQMALTLAKKLYYVSRYAVPIVNASEEEFEGHVHCSDANLILIGHPQDNPWLEKLRCGFGYVRFHKGASKGFTVRGESYVGEKVGLLALGQLQDGRIGLVVHGTDTLGLIRAGQRVPIASWQTGADFLVVGPDVGWEGSGGILAGGYLDANWHPSATSSWAQREHSVAGASWSTKREEPEYFETGSHCVYQALASKRFALAAQRSTSFVGSLLLHRSESYNVEAVCSAANVFGAKSAIVIMMSLYFLLAPSF